MLIILEGCDGVGKTTLAKQLKTILGAQIVHCTIKTPNDYDFFHAIIEASKTQHIIADRFMYGQFVYQKENERKLTLKQLHTLETECLQAGAKVIHVRAESWLIAQRLNARGETLINGLTVDEVVSRFTTVLTSMSLLENAQVWTHDAVNF